MIGTSCNLVHLVPHPAEALITWRSFIITKFCQQSVEMWQCSNNIPCKVYKMANNTRVLSGLSIEYYVNKWKGQERSLCAKYYFCYVQKQHTVEPDATETDEDSHKNSSTNSCGIRTSFFPGYCTTFPRELPRFFFSLTVARIKRSTSKVHLTLHSQKTRCRGFQWQKQHYF